MAAQYPVGHPKYKREKSDSIDEFKKSKKDSFKTSTSKTIQVTRNLLLRNTTNCCKQGLCKSGILYCEKNLCFSNLVVNILDKIDTFKDFFKSNNWKQNPNATEVKTPILTELDHIFKTELNQQTSTGKLRHKVATESGKDLGNGDQQDAVEYLDTIFELLQQEFIVLGVNNLVHDIFQFSEVVKKRFISNEENGGCPTCHMLPDDRIDEKNIFRLPLPDIMKGDLSLENLIHEYYSEKPQPAMRCAKCCPDHGKQCKSTSICSTERDYMEKREIIKNADYLIIQVLRFNSAGHKLGVTVIPEDILTLPGTNGDNGDQFEIVSIGDHEGDTVVSGHYVVQTIANKTWLTVDDNKRPKKKRQPKSMNNYIYLYKKITKANISNEDIVSVLSDSDKKIPVNISDKVQEENNFLWEAILLNLFQNQIQINSPKLNQKKEKQIC